MLIGVVAPMSRNLGARGAFLNPRYPEDILPRRDGIELAATLTQPVGPARAVIDRNEDESLE